MSKPSTPEKQAFDRERREVLQQLEDWLEMPMLLQAIGTVIWIIFILDFIFKFSLAPRKLAYLKSNWLTAIALLLPALRIFRIARFIRVLGTARATRGLNLVRVMTRTNRGMRALGASMGRRGLGYVGALTLLVTLVGAAGMYAFENNTANGEGLNNYGTALWWTAMLITTMGSQYWPQTAEGRVLCFILAVYAFAVFGYVTAAIATFFLGRDAENEEAEIAGAKSIDALHDEIKALRADIQALTSQNNDAL